MGQISSKLRSLAGGGLSYWCQGCERLHTVTVGEGEGPRWGYNGNADAPTFTPSVLVRTGHHVGSRSAEDCDLCRRERDVCNICHTFITDGHVQFLGDCTHPLAGQTLPLPDLPAAYRDPVPAAS